MSGALVFLAWQRSGVYALASNPATPVPRLQASVHLELRERDGTGKHEADVPFEIMGPGDARGLRGAAIRRMVPPPDAADAEASKCVHVELANADLPWRYTPELNNGMVLRPWIALVVGTTEEIELLPDNEVRLSPVVTGAHPLNQAARWVHVQVALRTTQDISGLSAQQLRNLIASDGGRPVARLLSPRPLEAHREYIAAIVPTFTPEGFDSWTPNQEVVLPLYHHWRFRTGPAGDFRTLAARLRALPSTADLGRAPLRYPRLEPAVDLEVRGALAPVGGSDAAIPAAVQADTASLTIPLIDPRGRPVVTPPVYGEAWKANPAATPWGEAANQDPRHRGVAGLGTRAGIELQDTIVKAVNDQVGAIEVAGQRIRQLGMGIRAATSLWTRRLPSHPMRRLQLYGPALRRIATPNGSVLDQITAPDRPLPPALFSSAARRILRRGPARTDLARPDATDPALILPTANQCAAPPDRTAPGLPAVIDFAMQSDLPPLEEAVNGQKPNAGILDAIVQRAESPAGQEAGITGLVLQAVEQFKQYFEAGLGLPYGFLVELLELLEDPIANNRLIRELLRVLPEPPFDDADPGDGLPTDPTDRPCRPVDLGQLEEVLTAAIDPTRPDSWIKIRVLSTIEGLEGPEGAPVEVCTSVDLPAWRFLRDVAPDWLLPGVGQLQPDSVLAFESNPTFVAAFMLGLNTQALAELRWRNLPIISQCTPLRVFWGRIDASLNEPMDDIRGLHLWADTSALGASANRPTGASGSDLVLVFRSELFRRYPGTVVTAIQAAQTNGTPDFSVEPTGDETRVWPVFQGNIGDDVTFFGFSLTPEQARGYWLVIEETPSGYRFRSDLLDNPSDGAHFAEKRLDDPTRVVIRGDSLIPGP